jgi:hypothetical protein
MGRLYADAPRALMAVLLLFAPLGCKKEAERANEHTPPPVPAGVKDSVEGHIRYHGVGLASGYVQFYGESGDPVTGLVMMGGTYTILNPPRGRVKIAVLSKAPAQLSKAPPATSRAGVVIPPRYADPDSSGLTLAVTGGKQTFDIALED